MSVLRNRPSENSFARLITGSILAAGAVIALGATDIAAAHEDEGNTLTINGVTFSAEDLLDDLIALDADDIADMRADFAEAQEDIIDAIGDIEEAREDVRGVPGGRFVLKIAFAAARESVTEATDEAFSEVRANLVVAEKDLEAAKDEVGQGEYSETTEAIAVIRDGMDDIQASLAELTAAMK